MSKNLTTRAEDYSKWYNELVVKADLAENSGVRGCMVIKPYGYAIWEKMQAQLDMQKHESQMQADMQLAQMKADFETAMRNNELQIQAREMAGREEYERFKAELESKTQIMVAEIAAKAQISQAMMSEQMSATNAVDQVVVTTI
jgi:prolyl-tRNA synthetase